MFFAPDNFCYFLLLFTTAILSGTYLFFSYYRNRLLIINAISFYLCAIIVAVEYYGPQLESFRAPTELAVFLLIYGTIPVILPSLMWYCTWYYIQPFKNWKQEQLINKIFLWAALIVPTLIKCGMVLTQTKFYFREEKLNGYWQFKVYNDTFLAKFFSFHGIIMPLLMIVLFYFSLRQSKKHRLQKQILVASYILVPFIYFYFIELTTEEWTIPNSAILFLLHIIIISWFLSEYRLFTNSITAATTDLLNSISDLAISTDLNLSILNANKQAKAILPIIQQQKVTALFAATSTDTMNTVEEKLQTILNKEQQSIEFNLFDSEKEEHIFDLKVAPLKNGKVHVGYTFLLTDLTNIRAKEKALEKSNTTKDHLFAIISHDLRKPALAFRGISKKVRFLLDQRDFETIDKLGVSLERSAFSLNSLLDNLLKWALRQKEVLPYQPKPIDVELITNEIYQLFQQIAAEKGIKLDTSVAEESIVFADPSAVSTIMRNLLDNAIKYTPSGGTVKVVVKKVQTTILVKIADTGIGMQSDKLERLFELYQDKSSAGTAGEKGTGLGLALVKDLVRINQGTIEVTSHLEQGTTFEVLLPAA